MLVIGNDVSKTVLNHLVNTTDGYFGAMKVHLYQNNANPNTNQELADFHEADFTGYTSKTITAFGAPFVNDSGLAEIVGSNCQFQPSASGTPQAIYGYYVTDHLDALIYAEAFGAAKTVVDANDAIVIVPRITLASQSA